MDQQQDKVFVIRIRASPFPDYPTVDRVREVLLYGLSVFPEDLSVSEERESGVMIPAEVIERAREAAYGAFPFKDAYNEEDLSPTADAALRSLLTDLLGRTVFEPPPCDRPHVTGEFLAALLRELGDE